MPFCKVYLDPWIQVANGVSLEVTLILPTQNSSDDYDDDGHDADGSQNSSDDPEVVGRVLNHSCTRTKD